MKLISVTKENLEQEHICCAISNNKDCQVAAKKQWLAQRFDDGLVFLKGDVRGKCFIEYLPSEKAWCPLDAKDDTYIDCLWISGRLKGQGYSNLLLNSCIKDSKEKGKKGLVILSSAKKKPFLADPGYLTYKGFVKTDSAMGFDLMYLPFSDHEAVPKFRDCVKEPIVPDEGFVVYYSKQCPFTAKYVPILSAAAAERNIPFLSIELKTTEEAQNAPSPVTSFSLFYNKELITHEILSEAKFLKLCEKKGFQQ